MGRNKSASLRSSKSVIRFMYSPRFGYFSQKIITKKDKKRTGLLSKRRLINPVFMLQNRSPSKTLNTQMIYKKIISEKGNILYFVYDIFKQLIFVMSTSTIFIF